MNPAPSCRWFRFSLRTLFVVVTVVACWLGYGLNWIRQRHAFLRTDSIACRPMMVHRGGTAPLPLRLLSESGVIEISVGFDGVFGVPSNAEQQKELERIRRLFPEAKIDGYVYRELVSSGQE